MRRLDGKVVLITGTAGGQGRAAALLFAAEGAIVVGTDVNADGAAETVESVRAAGGSMDSTHPLDLADEDGVEAWVDAAVAAHGGIDVVYNNAGATLFSPIAETPSAGSPDSAPCRPAASSRAVGGTRVLPLLVGSTAGISGSLAAEGAALGIRANCISPGMIRTPRRRVTCSRTTTRCGRSPGRSRSAGSVHRRRSPGAPSSSPPTRPPT